MGPPYPAIPINTPWLPLHFHQFSEQRYKQTTIQNGKFEFTFLILVDLQSFSNLLVKNFDFTILSYPHKRSTGSCASFFLVVNYLVNCINL